MYVVGELGRVVVQASDDRILAGVSSTVKEDKALGLVVGTEELAQVENAEVGNIERGEGDRAERFVDGIGGVALGDTRPDVGFGELELDSGLEVRAIDLVPVSCELPEILEDLKTSLISQDGFGVVLDSPERLVKMPDTHDNFAVFLILGPCQLFDFSSNLGLDVERVVADDLDIGQTREDFGAGVLDNGNLTVLHGTETVNGGAVLDTQTLLAQADTKDGNKVLIGDLPKVTDNTNISGDIWRTGAGANNDG